MRYFSSGQEVDGPLPARVIREEQVVLDCAGWGLRWSDVEESWSLHAPLYVVGSERRAACAVRPYIGSYTLFREALAALKRAARTTWEAQVRASPSPSDP